MRYNVDSLTHGLVGYLIFSTAGVPGIFLPAIIMGAVAPDLDILFMRISDRFPRFFIFTHGGFTHSIAGALVVSGFLYAITFMLAFSGIPVPAGPNIFLSFLSGSVLHVILDILAYPGIPVAYPFSVEKYTLGIFPGPSIFLMGVTMTYLALVVSGVQNLSSPAVYVIIVIGFIAFRSVLKLYMTVRYDGQSVPTFNPLKWLILRKNEDEYSLYSLRFGGQVQLLGRFPRYINISRKEVAEYDDLPEVKRHRYYSYLSVAERSGGTVVFHDPFREGKYVFYPPYHVRLVVPAAAGDNTEE